MPECSFLSFVVLYTVNRNLLKSGYITFSGPGVGCFLCKGSQEVHVGSSIWFQAELWRRRRLCERSRGAAVKHSGEPTAVMIPQTDLLLCFLMVIAHL